MQTFDEHILTETSDSARFGAAESRDFLEPESHDGDDTLASEESTEEKAEYTDDPVRVYLREMGSVSLLNRQAEVALARRMERGTLRTQKALSRSPLIRQKALAAYNDI